MLGLAGMLEVASIRYTRIPATSPTTITVFPYTVWWLTQISFRYHVIQAVDSFVYFNLVVPSQAVQLRHVSQLAQGSVRFRSVPAQFALEAYLLHDLLRHFLYAQLLARAHVDVAVTYLRNAVGVLYCGAIRILEVHVQQHMHAGVRHLFAPQELTLRLSGAPQRYSFGCYAVVCQHLRNLLFVRCCVRHNLLDKIHPVMQVGHDVAHM